MRVLRAITFTIAHPITALTRLCVALAVLIVLGAMLAGALDSAQHTASALLHWPHLSAADSTTVNRGLPLLVGTLIAFIAVLAFPLAWLSRWYHAHVGRPAPRARGARWATLFELLRAGFLARVGWPLGTIRVFGFRLTLRLPLDREREGVYIVAPPGSGKTSGVMIPAILSEGQPRAGALRSEVVVDPKTELTHKTRPTLARTHRILIWDLSRPANCTVTFDPLATLPAAHDEGFVDAVCDLATTMFWATRGGAQSTDPFFINQPLALMKAAFLLYLDLFPDGSFVQMGDWLRSLTFDEFQTALDDSRSAHVRLYAKQAASLGENERASGGIFADIQQRWETFATPRVRIAMARDRCIDWAQFVAVPTCLYVRVDRRDTERLAPLVSLYVACMNRALIALAGPEKSLEREVRVFIDEWGVLPCMYDFENQTATARSAGVGYVLIAQSSAQVERHYGPILARAILDTLVTKICISAADTDAQEFSRRIGERTEYLPTTTYNAGGVLRGHSASHGYAPDTRPLVAAAEIIHMSGTVLLSTRGVHPVRATLAPYDKDEALVHRLKADKVAWDARMAAQASSQPAHGVHQPVPPMVPPAAVPDLEPALHVLSSDDLPGDDWAPLDGADDKAVSL